MFWGIERSGQTLFKTCEFFGLYHGGTDKDTENF